MAFVNQRLSHKVEVGFKGGPMWNTTRVPNAGGYDARYQNWSMPKYKYMADYTLLDPSEQNEIMSAFMALRGQRDSFRFKDWGDYRATNQTLGTGDGTATPRQLRKYYTFGSASLGRDIVLPVASTVAVLANGSPLSVTVDDETGMVTPVTNWPNGQVITASFQFDVRVTFASDHYPFTLPVRHVAQVSIDLIEEPTP